ncbi:MAG: hypothetical protein A4E52_00546 [Pelotomaculum sp. PtaB.Bin013]|nr:MAG: hypothetical protein A4E52_00546 [Pelotomaculum sp. PtaB.Bin013]
MILILILLLIVGLLSLPLTFKAGGRLCIEEQQLDVRIAWGWRLLVATIGMNRGKMSFALRLAGATIPVNRKNPGTVKAKEKRKTTRRKKERHGFNFLTISKVLSRKFLAAVLGFIKKVFRSLGLRLRLAGIYGTGDPALTGLLAGLMGTLNAGHVNLDLDADFSGPVLDIAGETSGRIVPVVILYLTIRFLFAGPVRNLWWTQLKSKFVGRKLKEGAQYV